MPTLSELSQHPRPWATRSGIISTPSGTPVPPEVAEHARGLGISFLGVDPVPDWMLQIEQDLAGLQHQITGVRLGLNACLWLIAGDWQFEVSERVHAYPSHLQMGWVVQYGAAGFGFSQTLIQASDLREIGSAIINLCGR